MSQQRCRYIRGVALTRMYIAKIKKAAFMVDGEMDSVTGRYVADIEITAPGALAVDACRYLTVWCGTDGTDERCDGPTDIIAKMKCAIAHGTTGTGGVPEDFCGVFG